MRTAIDVGFRVRIIFRSVLMFRHDVIGHGAGVDLGVRIVCCKFLDEMGGVMVMADGGLGECKHDAAVM